MKTHFVLTVLLSIPVTTRSAESPAQPMASTNPIVLTPANVAGWVEEMRTNHPALKALDASVRAASHAGESVRTWEDPTFKFGGIARSSRGANSSEEGNLVYGVDQKLPLFGKATAVRRVARAGADAESARQTLQFQRLRRDLTKLLFETAYEERALELGREDLAWLDLMVATTGQRYRSGAGSSVEWLRTQNARARREELLRTETLRRDHSLLAINRLLHREFDAVIAKFELPAIASPVVYSPRLVDLAVRFEPTLNMMDREVQVAEAQTVATRKTRLPDLSAGIEGRQYSGDGGFREGMFTVSLNIPWFNNGKYQSDHARDLARLEAARWNRADYELSVREEVHQVTLAIDAARREALLYRNEIIPRSQQALESAHAAWIAGNGMFNDVMEARRMLVEAQLTFARAVATQYQALSDLVLCCGLADLEALEGIGVNPESTPHHP